MKILEIEFGEIKTLYYSSYTKVSVLSDGYSF